MKKCSTLFVTLVLLLSLVNPVAAAGAKINGSVVNMRSGPGTTYDVSGTLYRDTEVEILQQSNGWNQIKYGSLTGWVSTSLLTPDLTVKVTGEYVNLRSGPGTTYSVLGQVTRGDVLTLIDAVDDWYIVKTPTLDRAYITASLAEKQDTVAPSPVPAAPPVTAPVTPAPTAAGTPRVLLNGQQMSFDVPPTIESGRTLVPLRAIFEAMGAVVDWDAASSTVTAMKGTTIVILPVGSRVATVNGKTVALDVPAKIINGRTVVPLRFVSESFGAQVAWNAPDSLITITARAEVPAEPEPEPQPAVPEPEPAQPEPNPNAIHLARTMDGNGLRITIDGSQRLNGTPQKENGKLIYEFQDRQVEGLNYFKEDLGSGSAIVRGTNDGDNATVAIELPTGLKYNITTENDGKREVITIPNYIISVERKAFGTVGERIIVTTMAPVKYSGTLKGDQLEVKLPNLLVGKASSSYSYNGSILNKATIAAAGTKNNDVLITLTTSDLGKYTFGQSGENDNLNIILLGKIEPKTLSGIVVLDPGHGGKEPGASGRSGLHEKDVNLDVALQTGKLLEAKGIKVQYTRTDDTYIYLEDRSDMANRLNADVFVSIHCNSCLDPNPSGTESYAFTSIDYPELFLQQDERKRLATLLQDNLMAKLKRINRGVKEQNFSVLRETKVPSALVEMSFLSNSVEEQLLATPEYRTLAAQAIANAISAYMNK